MSFRYLLIVTFAMLCTSPVVGQMLDGFERSGYGAASYYNYSDPADVTILVNVWGTVRNPGLYEIPQGTSLSHLLSLSGGPIVSPRSRGHDRTIEVRLFRPEAGSRDIIFAMEMENEVIATRSDPALREGDVVTVETVTRERLNWRHIFPVIAAIGTVTIAVERLTR